MGCMEPSSQVCFVSNKLGYKVIMDGLAKQLWVFG